MTSTCSSFLPRKKHLSTGSIRSFSRERDGYRVQLDRGRESFWVPQSYFRNRGRSLDIRDLRRGDSVELSGTWYGGGFEAYGIDAIRDR